MKRPRLLSFRHLTVLLVLVVGLMSVAGKFAAGPDVLPLCADSSACGPETTIQWFKIAHVWLAIATGTVVMALVARAWTRLRHDTVILPLTTILGVLLAGQAFVGAILAARDYRADLAVLHSATAVAAWAATIGLAAVANVRDPEQGLPTALAASRGWRDFLRLSKPWIVGLLLVTTFAGMVAGRGGMPPLAIVLWTLLGGALAAAGSSALNQYIDRELDKAMQRTADRPLPSGRMTAAEGLAFGLALCSASYYILAGMVNFTAALLSLAGIVYYVVLYSILLKRSTVQNIVVGGGAGAIPPMVGWAAATGQLSTAAWLLFLLIFMWTPPHFWALAIVRKNDYGRAGVPMLPVIKGETETRRQILVYTVLLVGVSLTLPLVGAAGYVYAVAAGLLGLFLLAAAWRVWRVPGNKVAWTMYRASSMYLLFVFIALVVDNLL